MFKISVFVVHSRPAVVTHRVIDISFIYLIARQQIHVYNIIIIFQKRTSWTPRT